MAIPANMWIKDDQGADIKGNCLVEGREDSIEVVAFDHELRIPTDILAGNLTATRKHEPFVITKGFDPASPYLYKACANGQTLNEVKVQWYEINSSGTEVAYFTHLLEGVKITNITPKMHNVKDLDFERFPHLEAIAFRYDKITWTYEEGNISFTDSWTAAR